MQQIRTISTRQWIIIAALVILAAAILLAMGRTPICTCGTVKLWHGVVHSSGNSQHLSDWYSFSHAIHGMLFFALLRWALPRQSAGVLLILATLIEAAWEIAENTPMVIDRYRAATAAVGYSGDAVINSVSDIGMMVLGFLFAMRVPWRVWAATAIAFELFTLFMIRDNLTLNVLMLVWPIDAIHDWQGAL